MSPSGGGIVRRKVCHNIFEEIISLENLFLAWKEFRRGKRNKIDVQEFEFNLEDNLFQLRQELKGKIYRHSNYISFSICDPKPRRIHKATVRDRILHHAVFRILYPIFDKEFIFDSYSCRLSKGIHRAVNRLQKFCRKLSRNNTKNIFVLKCDIRKFFDSIDQDVLLALIKKKVKDKNAIWLIGKIIRGFANKNVLDFRFRSPRPPRLGEAGWSYGEAGGNDKNCGNDKRRSDSVKGLPLGNVTSQLFSNIYLNELDQFIKNKLKIKYYLRYCDDFVILDDNEKCFAPFIAEMENFLAGRLKLRLHPDKIIIRKYHQGIDFLGYVILPHYKVLRTKTKRRMFRKIIVKRQKLEDGLATEKSFNQTLQSYLGILSHCRGHKVKKQLIKTCYFAQNIVK